MLAERKRVTADSNGLKEVFWDDLDKPWMMPVVEFAHWFQGAGFGIPLLHNDNRHPYPIRYRLTRRGHSFLALSDDHPLLPSCAARIQSRCPGMPPEVLSLLRDARECLERMLLRPAVVVMGVAYEVAIEAVATDIVAAAALPQSVLDDNAAKRIGALKGHIQTRFPVKVDTAQHHAAKAAYDFADQLRARRNDAAHTKPTYGFEDREEVEEFLVSALRHLPAIWSLRP